MESLFYHLIWVLPLVSWLNKILKWFSNLLISFTTTKRKDSQTRIPFGLFFFFAEAWMASGFCVNVGVPEFFQSALSQKRAVINPWLSTQESGFWKKSLRNYISFLILWKIKVQMTQWQVEGFQNKGSGFTFKTLNFWFWDTCGSTWSYNK